MAYPCACCFYLTRSEEEPGSHEICPVCFWQDDAVGLRDKWEAVGPNAVSLRDARHNFDRFGACEERFVDDVRAPLPEEEPPTLKEKLVADGIITEEEARHMIGPCPPAASRGGGEDVRADVYRLLWTRIGVIVLAAVILACAYACS